MTAAKNTLVAADAKNRMTRSFLTGIGIDVLVAVVLTAAAVFTTNDGWGTIEWAVVSYSFAKSIVQAVLAYVLRKWGDRVRQIPIPVPPAETGQ